MLKGETALVTGSTSGIGLAIARALAETGCNVALNGFGQPEDIETTRRDIASRFDVSAMFAPADMRRPGEVTFKQPSHEFVTPEQVGALTVFLCSEVAAQIRGAALTVDGGWTAQ